MAVSGKVIKTRIKSVSNTKKITKAMEMVSAAKMRKAVSAALDTRIYATIAWDLLINLSKTEKEGIPLLEIRQVKRMLVILITSNRGLCGSFNSNIIKKTAIQLKNPRNISFQRAHNKHTQPSEHVEIDVIGIGRKGADFCKKNGYNLIASFNSISDKPQLEDVLVATQIVIEDYKTKKYDKVVVAYTDYRSVVSQEAKIRQVLPISEFDLEKTISGLGKNENLLNRTLSKEPQEKISEYLFEPSKKEVLKTILPRLVEMQIYQSLLESSASEHSARMMAMKNAGDSASDMIKELNLTYNKTRQAGITQEIAEIAGGAAALG
ncbi:MAG: ATP synthase F1 subunit gamma [Candidatus Magasanikbacteria bacterium CG_4_10_14_0_8_um_filter_32_14]|uniref:ATP synthase gamma chain n=1 Tax=Candidatus Magasanikbacteria bacterium CG_4_10_14_0_8_um_filter_32_14 TaxID=1974640 RepID=A0A2M7R9U6_9BACT|nr:MAG: ATP synthase F1 subunit gamma [Candidatus Magasanikbacteria bacterium CG_4_10_14_0_8_um_filter_32_14]